MTTVEDLKRGFEFIERVREEAVKSVFSELGAAVDAADVQGISKDELVKRIREVISRIAEKYAKEKSAEEDEIRKEEGGFNDVIAGIESAEKEAYEKGQEDEYSEIYNDTYNKGYNEGYAHGSNDGYGRGYNDGYNKGYNDGYNKV